MEEDMSGHERPQRQSPTDEMLRPPVNRAMRVLDRGFFQRNIKLSAAVVKVNDISTVRSSLAKSNSMFLHRGVVSIREDHRLKKSKDILAQPAVVSIETDETRQTEKRSILLRPDIKHNDASTWPTEIMTYLKTNEIEEIIPFDLHLGYDNWSTQEILQAILPEDMHDDIPLGFNAAGHIAHFNLRPYHLPYKELIGEVTMDKNPTIKTVVNKTENLGESDDADMDQFRVLPMEVMASKVKPPSYLVEFSKGPTIAPKASQINKQKAEVLRQEKEKKKVLTSAIDTAGTNTIKPSKEATEASADAEKPPGDAHLGGAQKEQCFYKFDFSKVFWNSRLSGEHWLLSQKFRVGEVVCDVMAGAGPFALPAGKRRIFVWANDLNPFCEQALLDGIRLNKVEPFVRASCEDGHTFIKDATRRLHEEGDLDVEIPPKRKPRHSAKGEQPSKEVMKRPRFFSHFVMNLPATAIDFVPDFVGLYNFLPRESEDYKKLPLPMVHCYCFGPKVFKTDPDHGEDEVERVICGELSEKLDFNISKDDPEVEIRGVRDVAPNKSQYCASFRLPEEVAYRSA